jgi:23S rRNA (cytidine1920-2'-O)/16S rRNA (cytidine1409-2'-O)-methyltransferase
VHAVDVGRNQLHERLRADRRVVLREQTDIRTVLPRQFDEEIGIVVADLSFISVSRVAVSLVGLVRDDGPIIVLVKPQFEAGRAEVSRGRGVIRDPAIWERTLVESGASIEAAGATIMGAMVSPLRGADGNVEFLVLARRHGSAGAGSAPSSPVDLAAVAAAVGD